MAGDDTQGWRNYDPGPNFTGRYRRIGKTVLFYVNGIPLPDGKSFEVRLPDTTGKCVIKSTDLQG